MQLIPLIKCQLGDTWDSNWHIFGDKQCQLNLNFWNKEGHTGTIDIFDYQTANAGRPPLPTPPFLQGDENQRFLSENIIKAFSSKNA